jgi:hypothetical protein
MSNFGTILAESLVARNVLRASNPSIGAATDATIAEALLLTVLKLLGDGSIVDYDDVIAEFRFLVSRLSAANGTGIEPALAAALSASVVASIQLGPSPAQVIAIVGQEIAYVATLLDDQGNPVPGCADSIQYVSGDDPTALLPPVGPANTDANGQTPFTVKYTRSVFAFGVTPLGIRATDADVPAWDPQTQSNATPGCRVIAEVQATMPDVAVAGVAVALDISAYDTGHVLITADSTLYYGLTVESSDAGATVNISGGGPLHAVPYDFGANIWSPPFIGPPIFEVIFSAPGTYTVTVKFQSASAGPNTDLATPDQVFTVVVS